jgi:hypothetical protein
MDLSALSARLDRNPYGLIVVATGAGDDVRRALWQVLARCETLYWLGPLANKPVVDGPAQCWLLECPLAERAAGLGTILRRDAHAIHVIGAVDAALASLVLHAALTGHIVVAEAEAQTGPEAAAALRACSTEDPTLFDTCLVAAIGVDGALTMLAKT